MRGFAFGLVLAGGLLAGCGSDIEVQQQAGGAGAGGGASSSSGSTSSTGGGAGGDCLLPSGSFAMKLATFDGEELGCDGGPDFATGDVKLQGALTQIGPTSYTLDSCPPNADCVPQISKLAITLNGADIVALPTGAFVELVAHVEGTMGCAQQLMITNLPTWGGEANPAWNKYEVWFAASDGLPGALPASPFTVEKGNLVCEGAPDLPLAKVYDLTFTFPLGGPESVGPGQAHIYKSEMDVNRIVRNLRSFEAGVPDAFWDWAWVVQHHPVP